MICSWPRIARDVLRHAPSRVNNRTLFTGISQCTRPLAPRQTTHSPAILSRCRRAFIGSVQLESTIQTVPPAAYDGLRLEATVPIKHNTTPDPAITEDAPPLSSSRMALSAAHAIRLSMADGNVADAYLILNSIYHANHAGTIYTGLFRGFELLQSFKPTPISFSPDTPLRFVSHALLHSLVRYGYIQQAGTLVEEMMKTGIKVHGKSLDAVFESIASAGSAVNPLPKTMVNKLNILSSPLHSSLVCDSGASLALRLLNQARNSRQKRTNKMFRTLITMCVINGEIIMASLLFGLLVKDWNTHVAAVTQETAASDVPDTTPSSTVLKRRKDTLTPWPTATPLFKILGVIERDLKVRDHESEPRYCSTLQALTNLAILLDNHLIPLHAVDSLLKILLQNQNCKDKVWVPDKQNALHLVPASVYFNSILHNFIDNLPTKEATLASISNSPLKESNALSSRSYNHLLRYTLLHQHSSVLSDKVIRHMTEERVPPLKPDWFPADCYRQAAVLLKDHNLWKTACKLEEDPVIREVEATESANLIQLYASLLAVRQRPTRLEHKINFLVSIGHPEAVVAHIPSILPINEDPDGTDVVNLEYQADNGLGRAVALGPRIYIALLNALRKSGHTGYAETVWTWAKKAEQLSWTPEMQQFSGPWCLPIQAYVVMLQIYGKEARRSKVYQRIDQRGMPSQLVNADASQPALGWGRFSTIKKHGHSHDRGAIGREMGMVVYRAALSARSHIEALITQSNRNLQKMKPPIPDAIFYNAILDIVTREPEMKPRTKLIHLNGTRKTLEWAERKFEESGIPGKVTPDLLEVAKDMQEAGYPIPPGLRRLFIGHDIDYNEDSSPLSAWGKRSMFRLKVRGKGTSSWTKPELLSKKGKDLALFHQKIQPKDVTKAQ